MSGFPERIVVEPDDTAKAIRDYLRGHPEIAKGKYHAEPGKVYGHCYVASEAYYHLTDDDPAIYCLSYDEGGTHWFLTRDDDRTVIDLSIEHPSDGLGISYADAQRRAFITGYDPSKRTQTVMAETIA